MGPRQELARLWAGSVYILKYCIQSCKKKSKRGKENNRIRVSHELVGSFLSFPLWQCGTSSAYELLRGIQTRVKTG